MDVSCVFKFLLYGDSGDASEVLFYLLVEEQVESLLFFDVGDLYGLFEGERIFEELESEEVVLLDLLLDGGELQAALEAAQAALLVRDAVDQQAEEVEDVVEGVLKQRADLVLRDGLADDVEEVQHVGNDRFWQLLVTVGVLALLEAVPTAQQQELHGKGLQLPQRLVQLPHVPRANGRFYAQAQHHAENLASSHVLV